jgi:hypothetical protein
MYILLQCLYIKDLEGVPIKAVTNLGRCCFHSVLLK